MSNPEKKTKLELKNEERRESKWVKYIIKDSKELEKLLEEILKEEKKISKQSAEKVKHQIEKFRNKFNKEEKLEKRAEGINERVYKDVKDMLNDHLVVLNDDERSKIEKKLNETEGNFQRLEKLGKKGGEIEEALNETLNDPKNREKIEKLKKLIQEAIYDDGKIEEAAKYMSSVTENLWEEFDAAMELELAIIKKDESTRKNIAEYLENFIKENRPIKMEEYDENIYKAGVGNDELRKRIVGGPARILKMAVNCLYNK